jgi:hypothetical protein
VIQFRLLCLEDAPPICLAGCGGAIAKSWKPPFSRCDRLATAIHLAIGTGTASCLAAAKDWSLRLSTADVCVAVLNTINSDRINSGAIRSDGSAVEI